MAWALLGWFCAGSVAAEDRVYVGVKVNGAPMRFGFDTGAGAEIVMWRDVAALIGLKTVSPSAAGPLKPGDVRFNVSEPVKLELWGRVFADSRLAIVNAPEFAKWQLQGLVGWPAVRNLLWEFDLARGRVAVLDHLPEGIADWVKYPIVKEARTLTVEVPGRTAGEPGLVVIDTGSTESVSLAPPWWRQWRQTHADRPTAISGQYMLANGFSPLELAAATEWSLGRLTLKRVLVSQANPNDLASYGPDFIATFGMGALKKLRVVVDGRNGFAYFTPSDVPTGYGDYNRLGAVFAPALAPATGFLARVAREGPAELAGIRDGDQLESIDGLGVDHWRRRPGTWPLYRFYSRPAGTRLDLVLNREGHKLPVHLDLQEILGPKSPHPVAEIASVERPEFHFLPAMANVVARAGGARIPINDLTLTTDAGPVRLGDEVTLLVTTVDGTRMQQWLVRINNVELKPGTPKPGPLRLFTSSGHELVFDRDPAAMSIHALGPFSATTGETDEQDQWSGALVSKSFLALGFDSVGLAVRKLATAHGGHFGFSGHPIPAGEAAEKQARHAAAGFGIEDERAFVGGVEAAVEFFRIAGQTPGVRDVLRKLLDLSWRDYLRSPNINIDFQPPVDEQPGDWWGLPAGSICRTFCFQVGLNGTPKLVCRVAATRPVRPVQTVAGVVGLAVGRTDGSGPHVMIRLVAAKTGS